MGCMPYWIQRTISGSLICFFCGSLVIQTSGVWFCLDIHCEKHADLPVEKQEGFAEWTKSELTTGTVSLASGSPSPTQEIEEGGDD